MSTPMVPLRCIDNVLAAGCGVYPRSCATLSTRSRVAWPRRSGLLKAKDTAVLETPAASATSVMVTRTGTPNQGPGIVRSPVPHAPHAGQTDLLNRFKRSYSRSWRLSRVIFGRRRLFRRRVAVEERATAHRVDLQLELTREQPAKELIDRGVERVRGRFRFLLLGRHLGAHR